MIESDNRTASRILRDAISIRLCTIKPSRESLDALVRSKVDTSIAKVIEFVEVIESEGRWVSSDRSIV